LLAEGIFIRYKHLEYLFRFTLRSHTVIFLPNTGQISTFGLACNGRIDTKATTFTSIPQKLAMPFLPYKTMKQLQRQSSIDRNQTSALYRKQKPNETKPVQTNLQVLGIYAGGNQIFIRISSRVCLLFFSCIYYLISFIQGTTSR
jgi:hypothetical protein